MCICPILERKKRKKKKRKRKDKLYLQPCEKKKSGMNVPTCWNGQYNCAALLNSSPVLVSPQCRTVQEIYTNTIHISSMFAFCAWMDASCLLAAWVLISPNCVLCWVYALLCALTVIVQHNPLKWMGFRAHWHGHHIRSERAIWQWFSIFVLFEAHLLLQRKTLIQGIPRLETHKIITMILFVSIWHHQLRGTYILPE